MKRIRIVFWNAWKSGDFFWLYVGRWAWFCTVRHPFTFGHGSGYDCYTYEWFLGPIGEISRLEDWALEEEKKDE